MVLQIPGTNSEMGVSSFVDVETWAALCTLTQLGNVGHVSRFIAK